MNTVLRIFDSNGAQLAASENVSGYSRLDYYPFTATGTYYVAVSGVSGSTGDYRLDLSLDHGDTLDTATVTSLVGTGSFSQPLARIGDGHFDSKDVDLYQFTAVANSVLTAATFQPTGGVAMDTFLRLFDSAGTELAAEDNSPLYSRLHYIFETPGTYYVGVSGCPNDDYDPTTAAAASYGSTGDYRLDLSVTPLSVWRTRTEYAAGDQRRRLARLCRLGNCQLRRSRRAAQISACGRHQWGQDRRFPALRPRHAR